MKNYFKIIIICICLILATTNSVYAQSEHVLPYPSFMPGSMFYIARTLWGKVAYYWHFGSFAQFKYNLNQSDKYLVEAKTLFEYKQYLLGARALEKSDYYFSKIDENLIKARQEGKDVQDKRKLLQSAAKKHIEVFEGQIQKLPEDIVWIPEKESPTKLLLHQELMQSIEIRRTVL